jgi:redox-sensitive bicupin YhaK (pirin superfamily)
VIIRYGEILNEVVLQEGNYLVNPRRIRKIIRSIPTVEGAGVHLKRAFCFQQVPELDPFLL